jgi:hypothetical protein
MRSNRRVEKRCRQYVDNLYSQKSNGALVHGFAFIDINKTVFPEPMISYLIGA